MDIERVIAITPFERPDVNCMMSLLQADCLPVLHLGYELNLAQSVLLSLCQKTDKRFAVAVMDERMLACKLPEQIDTLVLSAGIEIAADDLRRLCVHHRLIWQVTSVEQVSHLLAHGVSHIIAKGAESGGLVGEDSAFILFQRIKADFPEVNIWVQGGMGVHTAPAVFAAGAKGIVVDNQLALFPQIKYSVHLGQVLARLNGTETKILAGHRCLVGKAAPLDKTVVDDFAILQPYINHPDIDKAVLLVGQEIGLANTYVERYRSLKKFLSVLNQAILRRPAQAQALQAIAPNSSFARKYAVTYPIVQGPMTRVSDVASFAQQVADAGALPFVALSLMQGEPLKQLLERTKAMMAGKPWGVGVLGFASKALRQEQLAYIQAIQPSAVIIAGGRPSQAIALEQQGIKTFLHVPSPGLLEMFLKEGARRFVFEGRECGGHVGPASSFILWEQQIHKLLQIDDVHNLDILFAGGIHDACSAAIVSVTAAQLAARGASVAVLMGTAYLYTEEVVSSGAILADFQQQVLQHQSTVLLETAPGHETRCLNTDYVERFKTNKAQLQQQGVEDKAIWDQLEALNVGRLRIAAKGLKREDDNLVPVPKAERLRDGMYMVGQVTALCKKIKTLKQLHHDVAAGAKALLDSVDYADSQVSDNIADNALDIAIVGMSCVFAGASNVDEYWRNIITARNEITEVADTRWNKATYYQSQALNVKQSTSKWGGFIPPVEFDPLEFGIPPKSLPSIDAAQLLSLLLAKRALQDAGLQPGEFDSEDVSVIFGVEAGHDLQIAYFVRAYLPQLMGEIPDAIDKLLPELTEDSFPGVLANVVSGRIANRLDLGGRNFTVDAACASSLAAIESACQELVLNKSDMVIAGGVDLHNSIVDYLMFTSTQALSPSGQCRTFDASADGISLGEGGAAVILKRLDDARRDGDKVYAVIKGVGASSDGKSLGLTAPRKRGQLRALERAYHQAAIAPAEIGLLEAHGTGTVVGDKTELSALSDIFIDSGALPKSTHLGSVKTQIGHTKCAAGMAGLIKAALSIYHGVQPPTLNIEQPNAFHQQDLSPFVFTNKTGLWLTAQRKAGVSAFGFGGTNYHAVLGQGDSNETHAVLQEWPVELIVLRGHDLSAVKQLIETVQAYLADHPACSLKDIAYTLLQINDSPIYCGFIVSDITMLQEKLAAIIAGRLSEDIAVTRKISGKVAFLFPGQGSQRLDMARDLLVLFPQLRPCLLADPKLAAILLPDQCFDKEKRQQQIEAVNDTRVAQPLLGAVSVAIADLLVQWGVQCDMVAGHSYGEVSALTFAGVIARSDLLAISRMRAEACLAAIAGSSNETDSGAMLAVQCQQDELSELIDNQDIWPVNHNALEQWVLAGKSAAITQLHQRLMDAGRHAVRLAVSCAFHSPLLAGAEQHFADALHKFNFAVARLPVWSNTTAMPYPDTSEAIKRRLAEHLVQPVLFYDELNNLYADGARVFIETGPGNVLSRLAQKTLPESNTVLLHTEDKSHAGLEVLLRALLRYIATGRELDWSAFFAGRTVQQLDLAARRPTSLWQIDGYRATPIAGEVSEQGLKLIQQPSPLNQQSNKPIAAAAAQEDATVNDYLNNMQALIQAQRDVMLAYLDQPARLASGAAVNASEEAAAAVSLAPAKSTVPIQNEIAIEALLLDIVSQKTGYPKDMLGLDLDIEADLSIDSIKRVEIVGALRESLTVLQSDKNQEILLDELASIKTLRELLSWLSVVISDRQPDIKADKSPSYFDVERIVLAVVSEKTGYPQAMLDKELDLEADLSIDSIKRTEIMGVLREAFPQLLAVQQQDDEAVIEALSAIKSLQGLIDWISARLSLLAGKTSVNSNRDDELASNHAFVLRYMRQYQVHEMPAISGSNAGSILQQKRIAVVGLSALQLSLLNTKLHAFSAVAENVSQRTDLSNYAGLLYFDLLSAKSTASIYDFYACVQALDHKNVGFVYVISQISAGQETHPDKYQGFPGFINSLDKEWLSVVCRSITLSNDITDKHWPELIVKEILDQSAVTEISYVQHQRLSPVLKKSPIDFSKVALSLDQESVVLVLGGAQGITAEILSRMALEYPCRYILLGRSPHPNDVSVERGVTVNKQHDDMLNVNAIRKTLAATQRYKTPAELETAVQQLYKANSINDTLLRLRKNGAKVEYYSIDIRDQTALSVYIDSIYSRYKRLDGVIHAAGLLDDKFFHKKTKASFELVYSTKVRPVQTCIQSLRDDVKFFAMFSSIASVIGNRGQVDYAAANNVLDHVACVLNPLWQGRVFVVNWGPWKGKGMISQALEKDLQRRGIASISIDEGSSAFINELKYGCESQVVLAAEFPSLELGEKSSPSSAVKSENKAEGSVCA